MASQRPYIICRVAASFSQAPLTYAVGDIHGRLDLLELAVEAIAEHVGQNPFRVVFLGDYVDRGPASRQVIELLIELQQRWSVVCLKGNHEELMLQAAIRPGGDRLSRWLSYGGDQTLASYELAPDADLAEALPKEHLRWMTALLYTTGDGHRVYVHAGLRPGTPVHRQNERSFLWIRERFLRARAKEFETHVVHGHTPTWQGKPDPAAPELLPHRTNIDTGAFATGVLTIAVFAADTPGGPIDVLTVRGAALGVLTPDPAEKDQAGGVRRRMRRLGRLLRIGTGSDADC